jgi:hypothetical protein
MLAKIIFEDDIPFDNPNVRNLVDEVSTKSPKTYGPKDGLRVAAIDCGIKSNCIRALVRKGCQVTVLPWDYNFLPELESGVYDGLFISNGPGDPEMLEVGPPPRHLAHLCLRALFLSVPSRELFPDLCFVFLPAFADDGAERAQGVRPGQAHFRHLHGQPRHGPRRRSLDLQAALRQPRPEPARR